MSSPSLATNRKMSLLQELVFEVGDRKKGRLYYKLKVTKEAALKTNTEVTVVLQLKIEEH